MDILALCIFSASNPTEKANLEEEHLAAIRSKYNSHSIEKTIVSTVENMEFHFKKAVDLCRKEELRLVCKESHRLTGNEECLLYLRDKPIHFDFMDFPALHLGPTLEAIIGFLRQQRIVRSENVKMGIKKSKKKMGNPRLKDSNAIEKASKERQRQSWVNLNNFHARLEIIKLRNLHNLSFTKIAERLNEMGLKTRRDRKFHTKTVTRLYESYQEFKKIKDSLFDGHDRLINLDQGLRNFQSPDHLQILNWKEPTPNFKNLIPILLRDSIHFSIKVTIYNNKDEVVFQEEYPKGKTEINIDVEKTNNLYPGRHYIEVEALGSSMIRCVRSFDLFNDMIAVPSDNT